MMKESFGQMAERYRKELYGSVLPFWLEKSQDLEYGGYFTCLNRDGSVFDTAAGKGGVDVRYAL